MANERLNQNVSADEIAALKAEIAELKKRTEPYKPGDTIEFYENTYLPCGAFITSGCTSIRFYIPVPRPIAASQIVCNNLYAQIRGVSGQYVKPTDAMHLDEKTSLADWASDPAYSIKCWVVGSTKSYFCVNIYSDASMFKDYTGAVVTNNTCINVSIYKALFTLSGTNTMDTFAATGIKKGE